MSSRLISSCLSLHQGGKAWLRPANSRDSKYVRERKDTRDWELKSVRAKSEEKRESGSEWSSSLVCLAGITWRSIGQVLFLQSPISLSVQRKLFFFFFLSFLINRLYVSVRYVHYQRWAVRFPRFLRICLFISVLFSSLSHILDHLPTVSFLSRSLCFPFSSSFPFSWTLFHLNPTLFIPIKVPTMNSPNLHFLPKSLTPLFPYLPSVVNTLWRRWDQKKAKRERMGESIEESFTKRKAHSDRKRELMSARSLYRTELSGFRRAKPLLSNKISHQSGDCNFMHLFTNRQNQESLFFK